MPTGGSPRIILPSAIRFRPITAQLDVGNAKIKDLNIPLGLSSLRAKLRLAFCRPGR